MSMRVFAGLEASYRSLAATPELRHFDFYVLSDTSDPERQVEEEVAWSQTCSAVNASVKYSTATDATISDERAATSRISCAGGDGIMIT